MKKPAGRFLVFKMFIITINLISAGGFEEYVLVDDYIPSEEDGGNLITAKAGEVVKVLQKKETGIYFII